MNSSQKTHKNGFLSRSIKIFTRICDLYAPCPVLCPLRSSMMKVVLGEHSIDTTEGFEQTFSVSVIIRHYNYKPWSFNNDIMLIKVWKEIHVH